MKYILLITALIFVGCGEGSSDNTPAQTPTNHAPKINTTSHYM